MLFSSRAQRPAGCLATLGLALALVPAPGHAQTPAAAPAAARAADLTRESARLSLESDDLGDAPDTSGGGMTSRVGQG